MAKIMYMDQPASAGIDTATKVAYDNSTSGLDANTVQAAIDEVAEDLGNTDISDIGDGTVTGAISTVKNTLSNLISVKKVTFTYLNYGLFTKDTDGFVISNYPNYLVTCQKDGYCRVYSCSTTTPLTAITSDTVEISCIVINI